MASHKGGLEDGLRLDLVESAAFLAVHHNLTQLFNPRYFSDQLPGLLAAEQAPCALIFADLDEPDRLLSEIRIPVRRKLEDLKQ